MVISINIECVLANIKAAFRPKKAPLLEAFGAALAEVSVKSMRSLGLLGEGQVKNKGAYSESLWSDWNPPITWKSPTEEQYLERDRHTERERF